MPPITQAESPALFLNGVYESVLTEIETVHQAHPEKVCYLQPYSGDRIKLLASATPTVDTPTCILISLTASPDVVSYRGEIVGWRDKSVVEKDQVLLDRLNLHMAEFQPEAGEIYMKSDSGASCRNLIAVLKLRRLKYPFSVGRLVKISNREPLGKRTTSGGWSVVYEPPEWLGEVLHTTQDEFEAEFQKDVERSRNDSDEARNRRLAAASRFAVPVQVVSRAFRRNADVVVYVLQRAAGKCEKCKAAAPFSRASDGSPYLEVHHKKMLADGGEDSVDNAIALCPNCHRRSHFGLPEAQSVD